MGGISRRQHSPVETQVLFSWSQNGAEKKYELTSGWCWGDGSVYKHWELALHPENPLEKPDMAAQYPRVTQKKSW